MLRREVEVGLCAQVRGGADRLPVVGQHLRAQRLAVLRQEHQRVIAGAIGILRHPIGGQGVERVTGARRQDVVLVLPFFGVSNLPR